MAMTTALGSKMSRWSRGRLVVWTTTSEFRRGCASWTSWMRWRRARGLMIVPRVMGQRARGKRNTSPGCSQKNKLSTRPQARSQKLKAMNSPRRTQLGYTSLSKRTLSMCQISAIKLGIRNRTLRRLQKSLKKTSSKLKHKIWNRLQN